MRDELDRYYTPPKLAKGCAEVALHHVNTSAARVLEPSSGIGAFLESFPYAETVDIDPESTASIIGDFLDPSTLGDRRFDLVIGNPPFKLAQEFVQRALEVSPVVGFLLRASFLGTQKRSRWLMGNEPSALYFVPSRARFDRPAGQEQFKSSDNSEYVFIVWDEKMRLTGTKHFGWLDYWGEKPGE